PSLRAESDRRDTPADSAAIADRVRAWDGDVATGAKLPFRLALGAGVRRDAHDAGAVALRTRAHTLRAELETPAGHPFGASISAPARAALAGGAGGLGRQDLGRPGLRGEWKPAGLSGSLQVERTGEAENRRVRSLVFVGTGRGTFDATGNFVGTGDYE